MSVFIQLAYEQWFPDFELVRDHFLLINDDKSMCFIYEDGWVAGNEEGANFFHAGSQQPYDSVNAIGGFFHYGKESGYESPLFVANIYALNDFDRSNHKLKGNYPDSGAIAVLPQMKDSAILVRSIAQCNSINGTKYSGGYPKRSFCFRRKMFFYHVVFSAFKAQSAAIRGDLQDIMGSATLFRRLYRFNPWYPDGAWPQGTDPNNASTANDL